MLPYSWFLAVRQVHTTHTHMHMHMHAHENTFLKTENKPFKVDFKNIQITHFVIFLGINAPLFQLCLYCPLSFRFICHCIYSRPTQTLTGTHTLQGSDSGWVSLALSCINNSENPAAAGAVWPKHNSSSSRNNSPVVSWAGREGNEPGRAISYHTAWRENCRDDC